jgi:hypothetical protein
MKITRRLYIWNYILIFIILAACYANTKEFRNSYEGLTSYESKNLNNISVYPISFSYPSLKWKKYAYMRYNYSRSNDFSKIIPGRSYSFKVEEDYMRAYSNCKFAITMKKAGYDCLRHYEILAAGAVPYFIGIDDIPKNTMHTFPKSVIKQIMQLPGVPSEDVVVQTIKNKTSLPFIDHRIFDNNKFELLRMSLMKICENQILTTHLYEYLKTTNRMLKDSSRIAVWTHTKETEYWVDYQHVMICIALIEAGHKIVVNVNIDFIFEDTNVNLLTLYGRGFNISKCVDSSLRSSYILTSEISVAASCDFIILTTLSNSGIPEDLKIQFTEKPTISIDGNDIGYQTPKTTYATKHFLREFT